MKVRARESFFHERHPAKTAMTNEVGKVIATLGFVRRRNSYRTKYSRFSPEQKPMIACETRMYLSPTNIIGRLNTIKRLEIITSKMRTVSGQSSGVVLGWVSSGNIGDFELILFVLK